MSSSSAPTSDADPKPAAPKAGGRAHRKARASAESKDPAKQAVFAAAAPLSPGSYPVIFTTGAAPTHRPVVFDLGLRALATSIIFIFAVLTETAEFGRMAFETYGSDVIAVDEWRDRHERGFFAGTIVCLMQQLVAAHKTLTGSAEDTSAVYGPEHPFPQAVRGVCSLFGEFLCTALGIKFILSDFMSTIRRLAHVLSLTLDDIAFTTAVAAYYLPSSANDTSVDFVLMIGYTLLLVAACDLRPTHLPPPFAGAAPARIQAVIDSIIAQGAISELEQQLVDAHEFYFGLRPSTMSSWVTSASHWNLIEFSTGVVVDAAQRATLANELVDFFNPNAFKSLCQTAVNDWTLLTSTTYSCFNMQSKAVLGPTPTGSISQLTYHQQDGTLRRSMSPVPTDAHSLSLSSLFPCTGVFAIQLPREVVNTVDMDIALTRVTWIRQSLKRL